MMNAGVTSHRQETKILSSLLPSEEENMSLLASRKAPKPQHQQHESTSFANVLPQRNGHNDIHKNERSHHAIRTTQMPPSLTSSPRYCLYKNSKIGVLACLIVGVLCTTTLHNTFINYKQTISMQLSLPNLVQSTSTSRIVTTNDSLSRETETTNGDDDDDNFDNSATDTTDISNRLGSLMNRFQYYGTKSVKNVNANSNSIVMSDIVSSSIRVSPPTSDSANVPFNTNDDDENNDTDDIDVDDGGDEETEEKTKDDPDNENMNGIDEEVLLFQKEIRKNFNASLYRTYREFKSRSQRFPSVAERVKVYMSNWYVPPTLPCPDGKSHGINDNIEDDPRIQYNYQIQVDPVTQTSNTIVLLRQSQKVLSTTTNFFDQNRSNSIVLQLDMIPQRTRAPFIYNHTYMVQYRNDHFIQDAYKHYIPSLQRLQYPDTSLDIETLMQNGKLPPIPIILQQGDSEQYKVYSPSVDTEIYRPLVPVIKKFRYAMSAEELQRVTSSSQIEELDCKSRQVIEQPSRTSRTVRISEPFMRDFAHDISTIPPHVQPIISILSNYERHFNPLNDVVAVDRPWNRKKNMAVYRGALTGTNRVTSTAKMNKDDKELLNVVYCQEIPRCSLVFNHINSEYVDAKLVASKIKDERIPATLRNVTMFGNGMNFQQMLEYKAIIMLEGNDVSTGLKWSLYSNSVVLTPKPTCTSWAMEELLVPYVHYIPLYDNLTNVEEQVKWMIEHDEEAEQIAYNGKLWMMDLVYHTDVKKDTEEIMDETFRTLIFYNLLG